MRQSKKDLIEEVEFVQKNIEWWMEEISRACEMVDEIDSDFSLSEEEIKERFDRLEYLIAKADLEVEQIDMLEKKSVNFFKEFYSKKRLTSIKILSSKKR